MADPIVDSSTTQPTPAPAAAATTFAPFALPPAPAQGTTPAKAKTAFVVVEPKETKAGAVVVAAPVAAGDTTEKPDTSDQIKRVGVLTVVSVTTKVSGWGSNWNAIFLPENATDLDVVEVHRDPASTGMDVAVYPNKDEAIGLNPVNDGTNDPKTSVGVGSAKAVTFRKMSKALWAVIS